MDRNEFRDNIGRNIKEFNFHITIVNDKVDPRYAYSIGISERMNFELIFAGGIYYLKNDLYKIFNEIYIALKSIKSVENIEINLQELGKFKLNKVHKSWSKLMALGVFDYYKKEITEYQIIPCSNEFSTLEIPDMSIEYIKEKEPIWSGLADENEIKDDAQVITNYQTLKGEAVKELMRWEDNEWEMFSIAGTEINKSEVRVVSLRTMIAIDNTLKIALDLEVGKGVWRERHDSEWNRWRQ